MRKELLKGLTDEQIKKVKECKSSEEILALAKAEGVQLNEEQLQAVSGGGCIDTFDWMKCPRCGSTDMHSEGKNQGGTCVVVHICNDCGKKWTEGK